MRQLTVALALVGLLLPACGGEPLVVDRPFVLALIDNATDAPLFLGAIGNLS
jgi:serine protease inhibitor